MTSAPTPTAPALPSLAHVSTDDLEQMLAAVADNDLAVAHVLAELDRRPASDAPTIPAQRDEEGPASGAEEDRRTFLATYRERGESLVDAVSRLYGDITGERHLAAEAACNGQLLTPEGRSAGIDSYSLFHGNASRAVKWASDELLAWWEENGRVSWAEHMFEWTGHARYASDAARARANWVEYLRKGRARRRLR